MLNYKKYIQKQKDIRICEKDIYFFRPCIDGFKFLIDEYRFEKAGITIGRERKVKFKRNNLILIIIYEMGSLPCLDLEQTNTKNKKISTTLKKIVEKFNSVKSFGDYPLHLKFQIVRNSNKSVEGYMKTLSKLWDENKEIILNEVRERVKEISKEVKNNMNTILPLIEGELKK